MGRPSIVGCRLAVNLLLACGIVFCALTPACALQASGQQTSSQQTAAQQTEGQAAPESQQKAPVATSAAVPSSIGRSAPSKVEAAQVICEAPAGASPAAARQLRICEHTQQLHVLAVRLQVAVAKSSKDMLSVDVLKLSEQIQILAHQVQAELKQP